MNTSSLWNLRILFSIQHNREFDTIRRPVNEESCKSIKHVIGDSIDVIMH